MGDAGADVVDVATDLVAAAIGDGAVDDDAVAEPFA